MEKLKKILIILFIISSITFAGEIRNKAENMLRQQYGDSCNVDVYKMILDSNIKLNAEKHAKQRFFGKFVYYYEIKHNDEIVGYAVLDNVLGKVKPITFMVFCKEDKSVKSVEIIKYREQHGGAVKKRSWLEQFGNSNSDSILELDNDIDGISGATISVKSITKGVKKVLYLINNMGEDERDLLTSIK